MINLIRFSLLVISIAVVVGLVSNNVLAVDSEATRMLKARNAEFNKDIIRVSPSVYTAVGYGVSPVSMIVGSTGIVIIDTGISVKSATQIRKDFRAIVDKPVKAIIFTHGHPDHIYGASAFKDSDDVQIWAREDFGHEQNALDQAGINIQKRRGGMQAGFLLSPEQRINNGIAKAYWPKRKGALFGADHNTSPTHYLKSDRQTVSIAGVDLELVSATGETYDHLYVWLPSERVVFTGDNFYKSWPNLYAIRGSQYRDVKKWADVIDRVLKENPAAVVGGHTRPVIGENLVNTTLSNYRDAIHFLFDKTIEGINQGLTPNQLVEYVVLPDKYQNLDYLRPYYGNPEWAVRSIFNGYLGWFDGNASNLFPLSDSEEAKRIVKLAGGIDGLLGQIDEAIKQKDFQWATQLCDYVLSLEPLNNSALLNKADALTALADDILTATARNYYLSSAIQLRKLANESATKNP